MANSLLITQAILASIFTLIRCAYTTDAGSSSSSSANSTETIEMVIEVTRHGARAAAFEGVIIESLASFQSGQLTPVGQRQHFNAGRQLRNQYPQIFKDNGPLKMSEFQVFSSSFTRTIEAGISHIIGANSRFQSPELPTEVQDPESPQLLPPQDMLVNVSASVNYTTPLKEGYDPVPVYTHTPLMPYLLPRFCPGFLAQAGIYRNTYADELFDKDFFVSLVQNATALVNTTSDFMTSGKNFYKAMVVADSLVSDYYYNNVDPKVDVNNPMYKYLLRIFSLYIDTGAESNEASQMAGSWMMLKAYESFAKKMAATEEKPYDVKYIMISGHEETVMPFLYQMSYMNSTCILKDLQTGNYSDWCHDTPNFAASFIMELVKKDGEYYGRVRYDGSYWDFCDLGNTYGDNYLCPYDQWKKKSSELFYMDQWQEYCGSNEALFQMPAYTTTFDYYRFYGLIVALVLLLVLVILAGVYLAMMEESPENRKLMNDSNTESEIGLQMKAKDLEMSRQQHNN